MGTLHGQSTKFLLGDDEGEFAVSRVNFLDYSFKQRLTIGDGLGVYRGATGFQGIIFSGQNGKSRCVGNDNGRQAGYKK
jgi:hypothetical protein